EPACLARRRWRSRARRHDPELEQPILARRGDRQGKSARVDAARINQVIRDAPGARLRFVRAGLARRIDENVSMRSGLALQLNCVVVEPRLLVVARNVVVLVKLAWFVYDGNRSRATRRATDSVATQFEIGMDPLARESRGINGDARRSLTADDAARRKRRVVSRSRAA